MGQDSAGLEAIVVVPRTATCVAAGLGLIVVLPRTTVSRHRLVAFVPETFNLFYLLAVGATRCLTKGNNRDLIVNALHQNILWKARFDESGYR